MGFRLDDRDPAEATEQLHLAGLGDVAGELAHSEQAGAVEAIDQIISAITRCVDAVNRGDRAAALAGLAEDATIVEDIALG